FQKNKAMLESMACLLQHRASDGHGLRDGHYHDLCRDGRRANAATANTAPDDRDQASYKGDCQYVPEPPTGCNSPALPAPIDGNRDRKNRTPGTDGTRRKPS